MIFAIFLLLFNSGFLLAQDVETKPDFEIVRMDVFVRSDRESSKLVEEYLADLRGRVRGLDIQIHDVLQNQAQLSALVELSRLQLLSI